MRLLTITKNNHEWYHHKRMGRSDILLFLIKIERASNAAECTFNPLRGIVVFYMR